MHSTLLIKWTVADGTCTMKSVSMTIKRGAIGTSEIKQLSLTAFILLSLDQSTSIRAFRRIKAAPFIKSSVHPWHVKTWPYRHMSSVRPVLNKRFHVLCNEREEHRCGSTAHFWDKSHLSTSLSPTPSYSRVAMTTATRMREQFWRGREKEKS